MLFGMPEFILRLLIQPAFYRSIESNREPDGGTDQEWKLSMRQRRKPGSAAVELIACR
jgi:hypothetical protein